MSASAQYSSFDNDGGQYPSFQQSQHGPWGTTINQQIQTASAMNVPFDQQQFEEAKQNGCLQAPCKAYPSWPPPYGTGFIYPSLQKAEQDQIMGDERGCFSMASPFIDAEPILPSVNISENYGDREYGPNEILNMYDCLNTPQPISNKCFGYMPYDATYMSATMSHGGQAKGWLEDPMSPVPITSFHQPVAVGIDIPSQVPSDRNENFIEKFVGGVRHQQAPGSQIPSSGSQIPPSSGSQIPPSSGSQIPPSSSSSGSDGLNISQQPALIQETAKTPQIQDLSISIQLPPLTTYHSSDCDLKCKIHDYNNTFHCIKKSLRAFLYDITHMDEQPDDEDTLSWLFRRHRVYFLVLFIFIVLILYFFVSSICPSSSNSSHGNPVSILYWCAVLAFVLYIGLPETHNARDEAQKLSALFIITVALWALLLKLSH